MSNRGMDSKTIAYAVWIYETIRQQLEDEVRPPSIRELMVMVDISGSATIQRYLDILRDWNWIDYPKHSIRMIRLTRPTEYMVIRKKSRRKAKSRAA